MNSCIVKKINYNLLMIHVDKKKWENAIDKSQNIIEN